MPRAIDGDKLKEYVLTAYKNNHETQQYQAADELHALLDEINAGEFDLPERDMTPENALKESVAKMLVFIAKNGLLEKWKSECETFENADKAIK